MTKPLHFVYMLTLFGQSSLRGVRLLLSLYALHLGASAFTVGVLAAVFSLMPALVGWHVGKWSDRVGSYGPMLLASLVGAAGLGVPFFFPSLGALFIAAILSGVAFAMYNISKINAVGMLSTSDTRTKNFNDFSLTLSAANFPGPLLAGYAVDYAGHAQACLYLTALGLVGAALLQLGVSMLPKGTGGKDKAGGSVMQLLRDRSLLKILLIGSLVFAGIGVFSSFVPVYTHALGMSASTTGVIVSCFAAAAFVSRICLNRFLKRASVEVVLQRSFLLAATAFVLFPFFENVYALCALSFLYGFGLCVGQPITLSLSFSHSADGRSGEVLGIRQSVNQVTRVIAPVLYGAIVRWRE